MHCCRIQTAQILRLPIDKEHRHVFQILKIIRLPHSGKGEQAQLAKESML